MLHEEKMPFLDREHFTPHFLSDKRQGTVVGAVATLLGTLLGKNCFRLLNLALAASEYANKLTFTASVDRRHEVE